MQRIVAGLLCGILTFVTVGCGGDKNPKPVTGGPFDGGMKPPSEKDLKGIKAAGEDPLTATGGKATMPGMPGGMKAPPTGGMPGKKN